MMIKYKPIVYKTSQTFNGIKCELSVQRETLESLGMPMTKFFEVAAPFAKLQAERFYNMNFLIRHEKP